ncbi:MAG: hypothetical protein U0L71_02515 [Eggerthellaceae bacterium]|nr:hypothetical protein [Eggerthellaceae bacterium]
MSRMLIVTSRNIVSKGGELSLIKNRASALESKWGIRTDAIALCNSDLDVPEGQEEFGRAIYIRRHFSNPIALLSGYRELIGKAIQTISATHYDAVLLSGVGLLRYVERIRHHVDTETLVCADVHGYYGDGLLIAKEEPLTLKTFHTLAAKEEEWEQKTFLKKFDRIFTVTKAYKTFLCNNAGCREEQFYIVPCANGTLPSLTEHDCQKNRSLYRAKYNVNEETLLLMYSGGASAWQCLPQTVALYDEIRAQCDTKLVILSGDIQGIIGKIGNRPDIIIDSYPPEELPQVFCAADFCMMLREDVPTNHFAYPNKFLEYAASYKPVITTPFVYDIAAQIKEFGVGILYNGDVLDLISQMREFRCKKEKFNALIRQNSFEATLVPFAHDLRLE